MDVLQVIQMQVIGSDNCTNQRLLHRAAQVRIDDGGPGETQIRRKTAAKPSGNLWQGLSGVGHVDSKCAVEPFQSLEVDLAGNMEGSGVQRIDSGGQVIASGLKFDDAGNRNILTGYRWQLKQLEPTITVKMPEVHSRPVHPGNAGDPAG